MTARVSRRTALLGSGLGLGAGLGAGLLAACGRSGASGRLRIAAGESGGLYLAFGQLLARRLTARHPDLAVEVIRTEGSVDNLARLREGTADVGLCLADVAELAPAPDGVSALARIYENYLQVLVPASSPARRVGDLRGRRIAAGAQRSGVALTSRLLLREAGLAGRTAVEFEPLESALADLRSGRVDAVIWSGGVPTPAIAELEAEFPLRLLPLGGHEVGMAALAGYDYVARVVPSAGYSAPGLRSIGVPNLLLSRAGLADAKVSAVVDTLVVDAGRLVPGFVRGLQYLDPPIMIQTGEIPLHPAAAAAYRRMHG